MERIGSIDREFGQNVTERPSGCEVDSRPNSVAAAESGRVEAVDRVRFVDASGRPAPRAGTIHLPTRCYGA